MDQREKEKFEREKKIEEEKIKNITLIPYIGILINFFPSLLMVLSGTSDADALMSVLLLTLFWGLRPILNSIFIFISLFGIIKSGNYKGYKYLLLNIASLIILISLIIYHFIEYI